MTSATDISNRIIEAVIAQKLAPGSRLGAQQLAMLFDCSRTVVRDALTRLRTPRQRPSNDAASLGWMGVITISCAVG